MGRRTTHLLRRGQAPEREVERAARSIGIGQLQQQLDGLLFVGARLLRQLALFRSRPVDRRLTDYAYDTFGRAAETRALKVVTDA